MKELWIITVALGPVVLAALIAYALLTRRRLGPATREAQRRETERLYEEDRHHGASR
jgi:hypothetical protein